MLLTKSLNSSALKEAWLPLILKSLTLMKIVVIVSSVTMNVFILRKRKNCRTTLLEFMKGFLRIVK